MDVYITGSKPSTVPKYANIYIENVKLIPCFAKERFNRKVQINCSVRTN